MVNLQRQDRVPNVAAFLDWLDSENDAAMLQNAAEARACVKLVEGDMASGPDADAA